MTTRLEGSILPLLPVFPIPGFMASPFARHKSHQFLLLQAHSLQPDLTQQALPQPQHSTGVFVIGPLVVPEGVIITRSGTTRASDS